MCVVLDTSTVGRGCGSMDVIMQEETEWVHSPITQHTHAQCYGHADNVCGYIYVNTITYFRLYSRHMCIGVTIVLQAEVDCVVCHMSVIHLYVQLVGRLICGMDQVWFGAYNRSCMPPSHLYIPSFTSLACIDSHIQDDISYICPIIQDLSYYLHWLWCRHALAQYTSCYCDQALSVHNCLYSTSDDGVLWYSTYGICTRTYIMGHFTLILYLFGILFTEFKGPIMC